MLWGVPAVVQWKGIWQVSVRMQVWFTASISGLRIRHCRELWCSLRTPLGSWVAMAVARPAAVAPMWPPARETPHAIGVAKERKKAPVDLPYFNGFIVFGFQKGMQHGSYTPNGILKGRKDGDKRLLTVANKHALLPVSGRTPWLFDWLGHGYVGGDYISQPPSNLGMAICPSSSQ